MSGLWAHTLYIVLCGKISSCCIGSSRQGLMLPMLNVSRDWFKFNKYIDNWLGAFLAPNQGLCININCTIVTFQFHCNISIPLTWLTYSHHRPWTVAWRQSDTRPLLVLYWWLHAGSKAGSSVICMYFLSCLGYLHYCWSVLMIMHATQVMGVKSRYV